MFVRKMSSSRFSFEALLLAAMSRLAACSLLFFLWSGIDVDYSSSGIYLAALFTDLIAEFIIGLDGLLLS